MPAATAERLAAVERSVLPPRTLPEAGQLAELRKRAIPALRRKRSQSPSVAAACVRCLRLIGGPEADALLEAYLDHEEDEVVDELAQAVNPLRVGKVAEAVLNSDMYRRPFEPVRHVREDDLAVLDGTTAHLTLAGARLRTAEPLRRFSALETLWLDGTPVADLAPLAGLAGLRELSLDGALVERDDPALEKLRQRGVSISI